VDSLRSLGRAHQWLGLGFDESWYDEDPLIPVGGKGPTS
jgi:hypothetical protein